MNRNTPILYNIIFFKYILREQKIDYILLKSTLFEGNKKMQRLPSANPNFMIRCELVSVKMLKKHFRFSYKPKKHLIIMGGINDFFLV